MPRVTSNAAGASPIEHPVLFTGGVPAAGVDDVFRLLTGTVGARAMAYPDGELNERQYWIGALKAAWEACPAIERIEPAMPEGPMRDMFPSYRIRDGVSAVHLEGHLPYAPAAIESYEIFKSLRERRVIDPGVRFQVAVPTALAAIAFYFPRVTDWSEMTRAWTSAIQDEYRRMLEVIPAEDLVVQIDYCVELAISTDILADEVQWVTPEMSGEGAFARYTSTEYLGSHLAAVPESVVAGYHVCLGTFPSWPRVPVPDMGLPVDVANALAVNSGHRIDFFHLPVLADADEKFFAPLERLDARGAAIYLGLECNDGLEALQRRMSTARRFLSHFGIAHYCGYAFNLDVLPRLLSDLREGADAQVRAMTATSWSA